MPTPSHDGAFVTVSAGGVHSCGVKPGGSVACWGNNEFGQATPPDGTFVSVSAGWVHSCGVKTDGAVVCWGSGEGSYSGEVLPLGEFPDQSTSPDGSFVSVSAGAAYSCGVKLDDSVACWGDDDYGQAAPPDGQFGHCHRRVGP